MSLQAVFFDMGGTIEKFWSTPELQLQAIPDLQELLHSAGIDLGLSHHDLWEIVLSGFRKYHAWSLEVMEELPPGRVWKEYILAGRSYDPEKLASGAEDLMHFFESRFYHRELRPEVPAVLERIKCLGLRIGMISNTCSLGLVPGKLDEYKIRHYFDPLVLSSEYGRRKPDPAIFHHAARLANVPTSKCLYIGDRVARDVIGAHKAGYKLAVQIHNEFDHGEPDDGDKPDAFISNMEELVQIVQDEMNRLDSSTQSNSSPDEDGVQAIFFDAGDVLYHRNGNGSKLDEYLNGLGLDPGKVDREKIRELMIQSHRGQINQDQYREAVLKLYGISRLEDVALGKQIMKQEDDAVVVFPGVADTLHAFKDKGMLLGIITDTAQQLSVKLKWFEQNGFVDVWDSIISSWETGFNKPHPAIYQMALRQVGVEPEQAVFVGHKNYELEGARAVGMRTVAFNYDQDAKADYYINDFSDLLKVPFLMRGMNHHGSQH